MLGFHFKGRKKNSLDTNLKTHDFQNIVKTAQNDKRYHQLQEKFDELTVNYKKETKNK
ncbi:hypothetical protein [Loigolactobacillus backii]|uniref:hypothetical protein n=1 Tax=Loigolactobacillus backii TaxID=375175 RepID=UPI000B33C9F2|nr:hypothetical protein [Loigolactobacillus backii]MDA5387668.1 hypothetical protein [Loigolactobacillus backii]MDA5390175.1 hypothetical protein [Loigolactobacillus backii]